LEEKQNRKKNIAGRETEPEVRYMQTVYICVEAIRARICILMPTWETRTGTCLKWGGGGGGEEEEGQV
jgi:hypothetical protein